MDDTPDPRDPDPEGDPPDGGVLFLVLAGILFVCLALLLLALAHVAHG